MDTEPEGVVENVADSVGLLTHQVKGDLRRFGEFIEKRGGESGAWRGDVKGPTRADLPSSGPGSMCRPEQVRRPRSSRMA